MPVHTNSTASIEKSELYPTPDPLFLERLEAFCQQSLQDVRAFAERESMPFEDTRRHVAQWHASYLFLRDPAVGVIEEEPDVMKRRNLLVRRVLCHASHTLEILQQTADVHALILSCDLVNPESQGFLGGSPLGREYWRQLRGGGFEGAQKLKEFVRRNKNKSQSINIRDVGNVGVALKDEAPIVAGPKKTPASATRNDLYIAIRDQLREVSGIRTADMKWSHHDRLSLFNVQLIGWPDDIPKQNPSSQSAKNNKRLLELVESGELYFEVIAESDRRPSASSSNESLPAPHSREFNVNSAVRHQPSSSGRSNRTANTSMPPPNLVWVDTSLPGPSTNGHSPIFRTEYDYSDILGGNGAYQLNEFDPHSSAEIPPATSPPLYFADPHAQMLRYAAIGGMGRPVQYLDPTMLDWPIDMQMQMMQSPPRGVKRGRDVGDVGEGSRG